MSLRKNKIFCAYNEENKHFSKISLAQASKLSENYRFQRSKSAKNRVTMRL
jgi:hypothetical protein